MSGGDAVREAATPLIDELAATLVRVGLEDRPSRERFR
jgi:hypothetical protein